MDPNPKETTPPPTNGRTAEERLRSRLQLVAASAFVVSCILLADPLRMFNSEIDVTVFGMLLAAALILLGVQGVEKWLKR